MTTLLESECRTVHLPQPQEPPEAPSFLIKKRKGLLLKDLCRGESCRIVRLTMPDASCRKRLAELGLAEGMKVTVASTGDTMMLIVGGCRMGIGAGCAECIQVVRA